MDGIASATCSTSREMVVKLDWGRVENLRVDLLFGWVKPKEVESKHWERDIPPTERWPVNQINRDSELCSEVVSKD